MEVMVAMMVTVMAVVMVVMVVVMEVMVAMMVTVMAVVMVVMVEDTVDMETVTVILKVDMDMVVVMEDLHNVVEGVENDTIHTNLIYSCKSIYLAYLAIYLPQPMLVQQEFSGR